MSASSQTQTPQRDGLFRRSLDLLFRFALLSTLSVIFAACCVLLGKPKLLILAYVLLGVAMIRPMISDQRMEKLQRLAVIGEGLKIFTHIEQYYQKYPHRTLFFYLFFPITGIFSFFFSKERGRLELKAHFVLVQWIVVLLLVQAAASAKTLFQQFPWSVAASWLLTETLFLYFLCCFFAIPAVTTPTQLSTTGRRIRLITASAMSLVVLSAFVVFYTRGARYDNLIPIHIALEKRIDALKERAARSQHAKSPSAHKPTQSTKSTKAPKGPQPADFFDQLQHFSEMYLKFYGPRILAFHAQHSQREDAKAHARFHAQHNKAYQEHIKPLTEFGEHKQIFLALTQEPDAFWGMIVIPFRDEILFSFRFSHQRGLEFFRRWKEIPKEARSLLATRWRAELLLSSIAPTVGATKHSLLPIRRFFVPYHPTLRDIQFAYALQKRLIDDQSSVLSSARHPTQSSASSPFFRFLLLILHITMPLHILLLVFCQFRLREDS